MEIPTVENVLRKRRVNELKFLEKLYEDDERIGVRSAGGI